MSDEYGNELAELRHLVAGYREELRASEQVAGELGLAGAGAAYERMAEEIRRLRQISTDGEEFAKSCVDELSDLDAQDADYWAAVQKVQTRLARYTEELAGATAEWCQAWGECAGHRSRLRAALKPFVDCLFVGPGAPHNAKFTFEVKCTAAEIREARAAMDESAVGSK